MKKAEYQKPEVEVIEISVSNMLSTSIDLFDEEEDIEDPNIHIIDPDEFGEDDEYDCISLTFYADGILADDDDNIIDDVDGTISKRALFHFGDYEDDAVHIKNDKRKAYYEVLTDSRSYEKATNKKPHQDHGEED